MSGRLRGLRVVVVLSWADLGGSERQALLLARSFSEVEDASVEVVALTERDGRARRLFLEHGLAWHGMPFDWSGSRAARLRRLGLVAAALRRRRPDVLVPFCTAPNVVCSLVRRWTGASACIWRQQDVNPGSRFGSPLLRRAARSATQLVSVADHGVEFLVEELGAPRERTRTIRNGIELPAPLTDRAGWRERLGASEGDFVVCMLANFHEPKDHDTLLRGWRVVVDSLAEQSRGAVLVLAGRGGPTHDAAKALAFDLELGRSVRFLGDVEDVSGLVAAADAGVLSSRREGCPSAVLECMGAGLAVAGTDVPGVREAVGPDGVELLAPPGDAEALAAALARIARSPDWAARLGARNAERIRTVFDPVRSAELNAALVAESLGRAV